MGEGAAACSCSNSRIPVSTIPAVGKIPEKLKTEAPDLEWRKITALRNLLAREYFGVNTTIVWDVVANKLAPLESACRRLAQGPLEAAKRA